MSRILTWIKSRRPQTPPPRSHHSSDNAYRHSRRHSGPSTDLLSSDPSSSESVGNYLTDNMYTSGRVNPSHSITSAYGGKDLSASLDSEDGFTKVCLSHDASEADLYERGIVDPVSHFHPFLSAQDLGDGDTADSTLDLFSPTRIEFEASMVCGLCRNLVLDPIQLQCFHTFCRACILHRRLVSLACPWGCGSLPSRHQVVQIDVHKELLSLVESLGVRFRQRVPQIELKSACLLQVSDYSKTFGAIYCGMQVSWKQPAFQNDAEYVSTLVDAIRESMLLRAIQHPHLVQCLGYTTEPVGLVFQYSPMTMFELLHKRPLSHLPQITDLDDRQKFQLLADVCRGVQYLHSIGLVHGSLTTSNVYVNDQLRAQLGGFDFAFGPRDLHTRNDILHEEIYAALAYVDSALLSQFVEDGFHPVMIPAYDIFALGVIIWETLCEVPPFQHLDPLAVAARKLHCTDGTGGLPFDSIRSVYPGIVRPLQKCMSSRLDERWNAQELLNILEEYILDPHSLRRVVIKLQCQPKSPTTKPIIQTLEIPPSDTTLQDLGSFLATFNGLPWPSLDIGESPAEISILSHYTFPLRYASEFHENPVVMVIGFEMLGKSSSPDFFYVKLRAENANLPLSRILNSEDLSLYTIRAYPVLSTDGELQVKVERSQSLHNSEQTAAVDLPAVPPTLFDTTTSTKSLAFKASTQDQVDALRAAIWLAVKIPPHLQTLKVADTRQVLHSGSILREYSPGTQLNLYLYESSVRLGT